MTGTTADLLLSFLAADGVGFARPPRIDARSSHSHQLHAEVILTELLCG